jgi:hypothetical protein
MGDPHPKGNCGRAGPSTQQVQARSTSGSDQSVGHGSGGMQMGSDSPGQHEYTNPSQVSCLAPERKGDVLDHDEGMRAENYMDLSPRSSSGAMPAVP